MVNDSHYPIPQVQVKKERYIARDIKQAYHARQFHHISGQTIKLILHAVDNNILKNLPILQEDVIMDEDICGPSIPHLKGNIVQHKIQHVAPINITSVPQTVLDNYKEVTICCDVMHNTLIVFLNTISRHIMFATGSMIKNWKTENISDRITQVHEIYLQRVYKITHIHTNCDFKPLHKEMTSLGINLNCAYKK